MDNAIAESQHQICRILHFHIETRDQAFFFSLAFYDYPSAINTITFEHQTFDLEASLHRPPIWTLTCETKIS